jgi:hypothetical protein
MDAAAYQSEARDAAQLVHAQALARMMEAVSKPGADPELAVKVFNATTSVAQAIPKDKDPHANLPVFNITFVNGRIKGEAVPELEYVVDLQAFQPSEPMRALANINAEVIAEFEEQP